MTANIIDGRALAAQIKEEVKSGVEKLKSEKGIVPGLGVILVGENPASEVYVRNKARACECVGIYSETIKLPEDISEEELLNYVDKLNNREDIHGILVQLPLPEHINSEKILFAISPDKDVDGFHPINVGKLTTGEETFYPCTPSGIIEIIKRQGIEIKGKEAVIIGRSNIVGKPVAFLLLHNHATVTICHSRTVDLPKVAKRADILIVAVGKPFIVTDEYVKPGAIVIDVGINRIKKEDASEELLNWRKDAFEKRGSTLVGDVDFLKVKEIAGYLTPVPGGVGPLTVAMLMKNTLKSAKKSQ
ncbi:MAG: bifunctional methylenetetrahydrofolate dehydrogenase/methenyltetrahydrofolate cyclohydrolase FolD [Actinobacteria bacterium]|nr:bifunctional methylenetetrahydrofolate dehydrogenase/methenyltetrahydrofolate cyclohydrolase FolD [Actinomycetota bacterium]